MSCNPVSNKHWANLYGPFLRIFTVKVCNKTFFVYLLKGNLYHHFYFTLLLHYFCHKLKNYVLHCNAYILSLKDNFLLNYSLFSYRDNIFHFFLKHAFLFGTDFEQAAKMCLTDSSETLYKIMKRFKKILCYMDRYTPRHHRRKASTNGAVFNTNL